jgi:hypothetical protein
MDTRIDPDATAVNRGRKMGVAGGQRCAECGVIVHWRIEKFCQSLPLRFGGRIYCMSCQKAFPSVPPASRA